jgi:hypothetical protein
MLKLALITVMLLLAATKVADATAILVTRSAEGRVILAADSLLNTGESACKIHRTGRWHVLVGGAMKTKRPTFDLQETVGRSLASAQTLADVERALTAAYATLRDILTAPSAEAAMKQLYEPGAQIVAIAVADADAVGIMVVTVETLTPVTLSASWHACPGAACPTGTFRYAATVADGPLTDWVRSDDVADVASVKRTIAQQIAAAPTEIGGPVDVVELTASGSRWFSDRGSLCRSR